MAAFREEVDELAAATDPTTRRQELGDVLFATVAVARKLGVDAESALRRTVRTFAERYERFTVLAAERGLDVETAPEGELRALFREAPLGTWRSIRTRATSARRATASRRTCARPP